MKQVITSSPILVYPDPNKQFYLFTVSSKKNSWSGISIQYQEQIKEDGTAVKVPHAITYQSGTFQGLQKNWSALMNETYAIYMSFHKMVFYLNYAHVKIRCDHAPLHKSMYSVTENEKTDNWPQAIHAIRPYIDFENIKGKDNFLVESLSIL